MVNGNRGEWDKYPANIGNLIDIHSVDVTIIMIVNIHDKSDIISSILDTVIQHEILILESI